MRENSKNGKIDNNRNNRKSRLIIILLLVIIGIGMYFFLDFGAGSDEGFSSISCPSEESSQEESSQEKSSKEDSRIPEDGEYTHYEDVAEYIATYHYLPSNYVTKEEAEELGCQYGENPSRYGKMIGGDYFGNYQKKLPADENYRECDVDYYSKGRGRNRLVYTRSGKVYYTRDHYESFERLY